MPDPRGPRVTVLLCVHNGAPHLREAIESVLAQTYPAFELLVVDDGSTDASAQIAASYGDARVRLIRSPANRGLARSLNVGLAAVRGELVARHDADDVSLPTRLERQVMFLDAHPQVAVVGAQATWMDEAGRVAHGFADRKATTPLEVRWQIMFGSPLIHGSVMLRTHVVRDVFFGYDETVGVGEDYELWSRMLRAGEQLLSMPDVLLRYRVRAGSLSSRYHARDRERVLELMAANIAAYAPIGEMSHELTRIAGAIGFQAQADVKDVRRFAALLTAIGAAFMVRCALAQRTEIDALRADVLVRIATVLYRRRPLAAGYALARAVRLHPPAFARVARAIALRTLGRLRRGRNH